MNILITSAGQRVSLVRAFQQELKATFPGANVFTTDMCPHMSAACHVSDRYFQVPRVTDEGYIEQLLSLCRQHHIGMIIPTIDTELPVLAPHKKLFEKEGIHMIISSPELIGTFRDKRKTHFFFQRQKIDVPEMIDKQHPRFPLFIKPYDGSLSADTYIIHSADDLRPYHLQNDKLLFMEYFSRQDYDEFTVDMYFDRSGHCQCLVPRKRIFVRAGEINKGMTCKNGMVPFLRKKLAYIEGAVGCLTGQFFVHKESGAITGIEINGRFGGGFPLSYRAGANYPLWLIKEYYLDESITYTDSWEDQLLMLRYDDEVIVHAHKNPF